MLSLITQNEIKAKDKNRKAIPQRQYPCMAGNGEGGGHSGHEEYTEDSLGWGSERSQVPLRTGLNCSLRFQVI